MSISSHKAFLIIEYLIKNDDNYTKLIIFEKKNQPVWKRARVQET